MPNLTGTAASGIAFDPEVPHALLACADAGVTGIGLSGLARDLFGRWANVFRIVPVSQQLRANQRGTAHV